MTLLMESYPLWHRLKKYVKYGDLKEIAAADYGHDFDQHYAALVDIYDRNQLPKNLPWHPLEVLSLVRWSSYTSADTHAMEVILFCSVLLLAASADQISGKNEGQAETLIIALDCACQLEDDWLSLYYDFLSLLTPVLNIARIDEEYLYFYLARYLAGKLLNRPETAQLLAELVIAEKAVIAYTTFGPFESFMQYTYHTQRRKLWEHYLTPFRDELYQVRCYEVFGETC